MTPLKTAAALLALAAPTALFAAHGPDPDRSAAPTATSAQPSAPHSGTLYAMGIGKPIGLTPTEQNALRGLIPRIDPATVPPAKVGKLRGILNSNVSDAEKRSRITTLLN